ncbi:uncharacterized protein LOC119648473 [Hermetia illucens]|uniref:uncharacterized protein LOC119648473 n=1 Tax=Hermetia illucens TaxID=343691 RepID=UPI0018CBF447|nr:uncharacterized protein LOC119648473 [Hermetia illucens]
MQTIIISILTFGLAFGKVQILDYTNSQIIAIKEGLAKITTGNFKIIHDVDLDQYEKVTSDIATTLNTDAFKSDPLYPYLSHELLQTQELLSNLKPKIEKNP